MNEITAIAIVGVGAILPDAPDVQTFWENIQAARYSITDVAATVGRRNSSQPRPIRPG